MSSNIADLFLLFGIVLAFLGLIFWWEGRMEKKSAEEVDRVARKYYSGRQNRDETSRHVD